jgi:hypothetical protein
LCEEKIRKALGVETRPDSQVLFFIGVKDAIAANKPVEEILKRSRLWVII